MDDDLLPRCVQSTDSGKDSRCRELEIVSRLLPEKVPVSKAGNNEIFTLRLDSRTFPNSVILTISKNSPIIFGPGAGQGTGLGVGAGPAGAGPGPDWGIVRGAGPGDLLPNSINPTKQFPCSQGVQPRAGPGRRIVFGRPLHPVAHPPKRNQRASPSPGYPGPYALPLRPLPPWAPTPKARTL